MKWIIVVGVLSLILLSGCGIDVNSPSTPNNNVNKPTTFIYYGNSYATAFCDDKVICYNTGDGYASTGSCFRDADLVKKYCS